MHSLKNERGVTLVELLAAVVITSVIGLLAMSVMTSGFRAHDNVKIEAELRDEADIIMTELMSSLFTVKASEVEGIYLAGPSYYIEVPDGKIGFHDEKVYVNGQSIRSLQTGNVKLGSGSKIVETGEGQFEITLVVEWIGSEQDVQFETKSEIMIINGA